MFFLLLRLLVQCRIQSVFQLFPMAVMKTQTCGRNGDVIEWNEGVRLNFQERTASIGMPFYIKVVFKFNLILPKDVLIVT